MHPMAMGCGEDGGECILVLVRCADSAVDRGGYGGAAVPVVQADLVLAIVAVGDSRCRDTDRVMLVDTAAVAVDAVATCGVLDDHDSGCVGDVCDHHGALLEVRNEHDGSCDADRETSKCESDAEG